MFHKRSVFVQLVRNKDQPVILVQLASSLLSSLCIVIYQEYSLGFDIPARFSCADQCGRLSIYLS